MSNFCNPIKNKLTKMKHSFIQRDQTFTEQTPVKNACYYENKENKEVPSFDRSLSNANSLKKLDLLEKKSSRKQQSINFYRKQLARRKQKHQKELLEQEEQYEAQLLNLQQQLMNSIKTQQQFDEEVEKIYQLGSILRNCMSLDSIELKNFNHETLQRLQKILTQNIKKEERESDLLYSLDSETRRNTQVFGEGQETFERYFDY